ncbi:hypothetical protein [Alloalcanivorax profundimaris]|uniref:DUF3426 domain-containing protein n=1 Tax=Alloalcanivorax profundimaris TaxID=2735259 RepID=A0ABS0AWB2_9GAMM|nr:hypothetical protein [Alloalcanivorax profundimaris]MAO60022.1 hypothetical protein [Alcanivorax sp.]MCQ6263873.1 hypothetical protein [Alcanivorax sp. MM125-6]UWN47984.1 hypothetical protein ASALC70_00158 [Alcanivorax sp. ALC70]MAY09314.1 hypothetical protein [Alcanivorax sp.]MBF1800653.1 hypothetical protein [Alloalcanivorax profundimaris]|tara:strand:+ start:82945 stop:83421 length:477 start_codon:yes stop_codon:yes gene_type:complete
MRFLLILTVTVAVVVLLWGSWQAGRRPFYLALAGVLVAGTLFGAATLFTDQERRAPADPETVTAEVSQVHRTETTYRLSGDIANRGEHAVARVRLAVEALRCPPATACQVLYQREESVSMHIPANGRYPLDLSVPRPDPDIEADRWRLRVLRVEVYGR